MNNMTRFLSKREKDGSSHRRDKSRDKSTEKEKKSPSFSHTASSLSAAFARTNGKSKAQLQTSYSSVHATSADSRPGFFLQTKSTINDAFFASLFKADSQKKADRELGHQVNAIRLRLSQHGYGGIGDGQITYALNSQYANGDVDRAYELVLLFQQSVEGIIKPYNPNITMRGAENRFNVTCYLDALLFAMFARLESFEPILYTTFDDEPRRRLATLIRLWVNMLRSGMLIQTDITKFLLEALAACGWEPAMEVEQQDTSDAFSNITEILKLPLLTLKVDMYHPGAEDKDDDHKIIHERLLNVAIPDRVPLDGAIKLEDCLEDYFNNKVEVKRHLDRLNSMSSVRTGQDSWSEKEGTQHVEVTELPWSTPNTPITSVPNTPIRPPVRNRATSIIRDRIVQGDESYDQSDAGGAKALMRKGSVRKEVLMSAWQILRLIPWSTQPQSSLTEADIASHFAQTRPVLGICLKRYGINANGPFRQNTFIDIPLDIRLPHFIHDEMTPDTEPLMGNFKLSLQSIICHRGNSLNAGHYISIIRGTSKVSDGDFRSDRRLSVTSDPPDYSPDRWIKFDDLHDPRVEYVDIGQALKDEMPYLLFYQVQPTMESSPPPEETSLPPSYTDSSISMQYRLPSPESNLTAALIQTDYFHNSTSMAQTSNDIEKQSNPRRSMSLVPDERRGSMAFTDASLTSTASSIVVVSAPGTPSEEPTTAQRMSRAAQRFTKSGSKSRPTSSSGENRISATFVRTMNAMKSKEQLNKIVGNKDSGNYEGANDLQMVVAVEDTSHTGTITRSKSKKGRQRSKSKGPNGKKEPGHDHTHHHGQKLKGKGTEVPDRECSIM